MSARQTKIVALNLELLEKQKNQLFLTVDKHLTKVFQAGQQWMEQKQEHPMSFNEIRTLIDDAVGLIMEKAEEFPVADETEETSTSSQSRPSDASSLPGHSSLESGATAFKPMAAEDTMKKIMARIEKIEETVASLQTATNIVTDKQNLVEKVVQQRSEKTSNFEGEHARRISDVEKQVKKLSEKQKKKVDQLNTKIRKIETNITQLSSSVSETDQHNSECMEKIENQMNLDRASASDHEQYCKTTFEATNKAVEDLTRRIEVVETSMNDLTTKTENNTSSVSDLKVSKNKICRKLKYLEDGLKSEETRRKKAVETLEKKVVETEQAIQKNKILRKLKYLEDGLKSEETRRKKAVEILEKKVVETEQASEMGNRIMGERLRDVVEFKSLLNKIALQKGANNVAKLHKLADDFGVMVDRLKQVETVCTKQSIGFSARLNARDNVTSNSVCTKFINVISNLGGHYDPTTCVFTAPLDGVYVTFIGIMQYYVGDWLKVTVRHSQGGNAVDGNGRELCRVDTYGDNQSMSGMGVVEMKVGDKLYVWVEGGNAELRSYSNYSCFLIG